ncbi:MAG: metallophosphoesterase [Lentisphaeria bacterium]|nr:metallophosphoesterase [Lentisphaeria bacterium]
MMWRRKKFPAAVLLSSGIVLRMLDIAAEADAAGCRILFFSDTHFRYSLLRNRCSCSPLKEWSGAGVIGDALIRSVEEVAPDVLIFGGDLVSHTVLYPEAFRILSQLNAPVKLAVCGNWERKTRSWLPAGMIERGFRDAGFQLLQNETVTVNGVQFSGVEDFRYGRPVIPAANPDAAFRCLISHNPDMIGKTAAEALSGYHLALSGHTHGGQIRLPLFGAVLTSSVYWKRFEYGLCTHPEKLPVVVSAGIGGTFIMNRLFCPPEMLLVSLKLPQ